MSRSFAEILQDEIRKNAPSSGKAHTSHELHSTRQTTGEPKQFFDGMNLLFFERPLSQPPRLKVQVYQSHTPSIVQDEIPVEEPQVTAPPPPVIRLWTSTQQLALQQLQRLGAELTDSSTDAEIKKAYRKLALRYHPDQNPHLSELELKRQTERFLLLQESVDLLLDNSLAQAA